MTDPHALRPMILKRRWNQSLTIDYGMGNIHDSMRLEIVANLRRINAETSDLNPSVMCTSKSEKGDSLCLFYDKFEPVHFLRRKVFVFDSIDKHRGET